MGFRFRFEVVLRQKQHAVDEVASRYAQAMRLVQGERDNLTLLENAAAVHEERYTAVLASGALDAAGLQTSARYAGFLRQAIEEQGVRITEMEQRAEQIRQLLVVAERDKEVFARLKERQRERFYTELATRERAYFDEVANTTFAAKHQAAALARRG